MDANNYEGRLERLRKKIPDEFEELDSRDEDALKRRILEAQAALVENKRLKEADEDLETAQDTAKRLGAPYRDAQKRLTAIAEYCSIRLEELGR